MEPLGLAKLKKNMALGKTKKKVDGGDSQLEREIDPEEAKGQNEEAKVQNEEAKVVESIEEKKEEDPSNKEEDLSKVKKQTVMDSFLLKIDKLDALDLEPGDNEYDFEYAQRLIEENFKKQQEAEEREKANQEAPKDEDPNEQPDSNEEAK